MAADALKRIILVTLPALSALPAQAQTISQLPSASTPLTGAELVPIVQLGKTKKVAISNIGGGGSGSGITAVTGTAPIVATTSGSSVTVSINYTSPLALSGSSLIISANGITNALLAQASANTIKGNFTSATANESDNAMPSCSSASSALIYTTSSGLGCNNAVVASTAAVATTIGTTATNANSTFFPALLPSSSTGNQAVAVAAGLSYNPSTGVLSATTFSGAATTVATTVTSGNSSFFIPFVASAGSANQALDTNAGISYNPSTQTLSVTNFTYTSAFTGVSNTIAGADLVNASVTGTQLSANTKTVDIGCIIDGGGAAITSGQQCRFIVDFACTISQATLLADQTGSATVAMWKVAYASYPPTSGNSITASATPALAGANKYQDATLTGWTTSVSAGDTFIFNVTAISSVTQVAAELKCAKT